MHNFVIAIALGAFSPVQDSPIHFRFDYDIPTFIRTSGGYSSLFVGSRGHEEHLSSLVPFKNHVHLRNAEQALSFVRVLTPLWITNDVQQVEVASFENFDTGLTLGIDFDREKLRQITPGRWGLISNTDMNRLGLAPAQSWQSKDQFYVVRDVVCRDTVGDYHAERWFETVAANGKYNRQVLKEFPQLKDETVAWWFPGNKVARPR